MGVEAINGLDGDITLAAGSNITLTELGNTITIASTGGSSSTPQSSTTTYNTDGTPSLITFADNTYISFTYSGGVLQSKTNGKNTRTFNWSGNQLVSTTIS
jgi:hypothetical protein